MAMRPTRERGKPVPLVPASGSWRHIYGTCGLVQQHNLDAALHDLRDRLLELVRHVGVRSRRDLVGVERRRRVGLRIAMVLHGLEC